jgi:hypothetical protein
VDADYIYSVTFQPDTVPVAIFERPRKMVKTGNSDSQPGDEGNIRAGELNMLTPEQVAQIDRMLESVKPYGEVHIIVQQGRVRYINRVESYKAWE